MYNIKYLQNNRSHNALVANLVDNSLPLISNALNSSIKEGRQWMLPKADDLQEMSSENCGEVVG